MTSGKNVALGAFPNYRDLLKSNLNTVVTEVF